LRLHRFGGIEVKAASPIRGKLFSSWKYLYTAPQWGGLILDFFYIFNKSTPGICYIPSKCNENSKNKIFDPVSASSLVTTFWVMHYIGVQNFFIHNTDFMGIKRRRMLRRFQKCDKMHLKKLFKKKECLYYTRDPLCRNENFYPGIYFLGAFCH
jgi:hypothetical protein